MDEAAPPAPGSPLSSQGHRLMPLDHHGAHAVTESVQGWRHMEGAPAALGVREDPRGGVASVLNGDWNSAQ